MQVFRLTQAEINARLPGVGGSGLSTVSTCRRGLSVCRHFGQFVHWFAGETILKKLGLAVRAVWKPSCNHSRVAQRLMTLNEESNGKGWIVGGGFQRLVGAGIWI